MGSADVAADATGACGETGAAAGADGAAVKPETGDLGDGAEQPLWLKCCLCQQLE